MFAKTVDRLDEVFVKVEDLQVMRAFYRDVLGFEEDSTTRVGEWDSRWMGRL